MPTKVHNILRGVDSVFVIASVILLLLGLIILQTASGPISYLRHDNAYYELIKQLTNGVLPGILLFIVFSLINYQWLKKLSVLGWIFTLGLNVLVLFPAFAVTVNGATRWIEIAGIQVQPAEFLKLGLIIFLAFILAKVGKNINNQGTLIGVAVVIAITAGVVIQFQSNLSTGGVLIMIAMSMLFQSKIHIKNFLIFSLIGIIVVIGALFTKDYRRDRVQTLFQPQEQQEQDKQGNFYQTDQNLIAVSSGGLLGVGWGQSRQKFLYLPETSTDSIFAIFAEEAGLAGVLLLITLIVFIIGRIIWLYTQIKDDFGKYILIGGVTWFAFQSLINIATTIQLFPVTGVPLPFISSGGASMVSICILFGIITNISKSRINN